MTNKRILIAEDEKPMAKALEVKLKKEGFEAVSVFNGQEAVKQLTAGNYDLLLLDILMPVMDGFTVLEQIKTLARKPKIVITSNLSQDEDIKRAKDLGAIDFMVKSDSTLSQIVDKVKTLLA